MVGERVVPVDLEVRWDFGAPLATLWMDDRFQARLRLEPEPDDRDQRSVELIWEGAIAGRMEPPNDEAIEGHRLYAAGLMNVFWIGEVHESELIADMERRNRVHERHRPDDFLGLRHWVLPLKECVVEVVASTMSVARADR